MRLFAEVINELNNLFLNWNSTNISQRIEMLSAVCEAILTAQAGEVVTVPLVPGGGKSAFIRALLTVLSRHFALMDPIAKRLGGIIVVVEKSAEGHELEQLCNRTAEKEVAVVIESANDYLLGTLELCPTGRAQSYEECPRRGCPDYADCPLMQAAGRTEETPILIMLHARYQRHLEDMFPFALWYDENEEEHHRTLLLVDELPNLFAEKTISVSALADAEAELDNIRPSYRKDILQTKLYILRNWHRLVRTPFFRLLKLCSGPSGIITSEQQASAGLDQKDLQVLLDALNTYADNTKAANIVQALLGEKSMYYSAGQTLEFFLPQLIHLDHSNQFATFIFSGTARLSPEITANPQITMLSNVLDETFERLTIKVQHGDAFNISRTAFAGAQRNIAAAIQWLHDILPEISQRHDKVLLVTYKKYAASLWAQLSKFRKLLVPYYSNGTEEPQATLPYYGGMDGSNLYQQATCVISLGLNRFEPRDYLSRTIALDFDDKLAPLFEKAAAKASPRLDQLPCVMDIQDITLARDLVQLIYRSALRRHGENQPIEVWLLQPPKGVIFHLVDEFPGCKVEEIPDFSDACKIAATSRKFYDGRATHAAILLKWLHDWDSGSVTPEQIRRETHLTPQQFKEAKKNPQVRKFFAESVYTSGSGINTLYFRIQKEKKSA